MNELFINLSNFVKVINISPQKKINKALSGLLLITLILTVSFPLLQVTDSRAQGNPVSIRQIRAMESEVTGLKNPSGLTFSGIGNAFLVADVRLSSSTDLEIVELTPFSERAASTRISAAIQNPINMVYDNRSNRLLILHEQANQLLEVSTSMDGSINPAEIIRYDAMNLGLQNPQGMTIDEASGNLFILDAGALRVVKIDPVLDGSFNGAEILEIELQSLGLSAVRGLALDPVSGHLFLIDPTEHTLYELTQKGEIVSTRDLKPFRLKNPQAMVFALSGDQTDDPSEVNLYVADSGLPDEQSSIFTALSTKNSQQAGQIVEFSLAPSVAPAAATFASSLIRTTDMSAISPPSPDPSGIAYVPASNTLLIVDGEVEETQGGITHFAGANVWELSLPGSKVGTANISRVAPTVTPMTNEPTGIALNPANGHYYVTDDNERRVYDLNPRADGSIGTADDTWTYFSTFAAGSGDPEGVAFNTWNNHIFVVDGVNAEVYEFTISGALINQFDVQQYGVEDPEGIEFNPVTGTLFTLSSSKSNPIIIETTTSGALLQTIDISVTNSLAAAGLAYAPASDGTGETRFYIVDRGIDNNDDPTTIDGKVYEITAPASGSTPTPSATFTATPMLTPSPSPTFTRTASPVPTSTLSPSPTPTSTLTASLTPTSTLTALPMPTSTLTSSPTPTSTLTASPTPLPPTPSPTFNGASLNATTVGVFRPSNGALYLKNSNTSGFADIQINYGQGGDYPVTGDWDGNGTDTIGIYRNGSFYLRNFNTIGFANIVFAFGSPGDQPIAGDWNGDGIDTIGVYRSSTGTFFLRNSNTAGPADMIFSLGIPGDVGIAGDWDGDGDATTGVFRPSNGVIFLKNTNATGFADVALNYGLPGDKPVVGDWDDNGTTTIGVFRRGTFLLRNSNTNGFAEIVFDLGINDDMPIAGNWDGAP